MAAAEMLRLADLEAEAEAMALPALRVLALQAHRGKDMTVALELPLASQVTMVGAEVAVGPAGLVLLRHLVPQEALALSHLLPDHPFFTRVVVVVLTKVALWPLVDLVAAAMAMAAMALQILEAVEAVPALDLRAMEAPASSS
jgi:hypothetical protein